MKKYIFICSALRCAVTIPNTFPFFLNYPNYPPKLEQFNTLIALRLLQDFSFSIFSIYKIEFPAPVGSAV
jgi:hypothetical protein